MIIQQAAKHAALEMSKQARRLLRTWINARQRSSSWTRSLPRSKRRSGVVRVISEIHLKAMLDAAGSAR